MTPELRQLRYFVAVAEAGSLSRAAEALHLAQQSLSAQMRALEQALDARLLERSSRGVALTPAGVVLLEEARAVITRMDRAVEAVHRAAGGLAGELTVGFLSSVANELMPPFVRAMRARHPGLSLRAHEQSVAGLVAGLRDGRLVAALTRPPLVEDIATEELLREPVAAVLPEGHALAGRASLTLGELADEPWVLTERSSWPPWHEKYDRDFARAGFHPRVVQRGTSPQNLLALVAAGAGVTRLPLSARSLRDGGVRFVPLVGEEASVVLAWLAEAPPPALDALRGVLREVAGEFEL